MNIKVLQKNALADAIRQFKLAKDSITRYKLCLLHDELTAYLNNTEHQTFEAMRKAFTLCFEQESTAKALGIIQNSIAGYEHFTRARRLLDTMTEVYSDFIALNRRLENALYVARQRSLAELAKEVATTAQDYDYISKIEERAAKAGKYDETVGNEERRELPKLVLITSDNRALEAQRKGQNMPLANTDDSTDDSTEYDAEGGDDAE